MAHIPLIHGPDGAKLSKRHGALGVDAYRAHGLPAGGAAQLSGAARLEPGRPRVLLDRGADRGLRPAGDRPFAVALRLRQAREHERPFHARDARRRAVGDPRSTRCPICPAARRSPPRSTTPSARQLLAALPGLKERAKTLVELVDGAAFLFAQRPLAIDDKAAEILARGGRLHLAALLPRLRRSTIGARRQIEAGRARLRRREGAKLGNDRPAAARRGDRPLDLARHLRRAGGARPRREPRPHRRPGQGRLTLYGGSRRRARASVVFLSHPPGIAVNESASQADNRKAPRGGIFRLPMRMRCGSMPAPVWSSDCDKASPEALAGSNRWRNNTASPRRAADSAQPLGPDRARGDHGGAHGGRAHLSRHHRAAACAERSPRSRSITGSCPITRCAPRCACSRRWSLARLHVHLRDAGGEEPARGDGADPDPRHPAVGADARLPLVHGDVLPRAVSRQRARRRMRGDLRRSSPARPGT